jgi:hypothetical protein
MRRGPPFLLQTGFYLRESQGGLEPVSYSTGGGSEPNNWLELTWYSAGAPYHAAHPQRSALFVSADELSQSFPP